MRSVKRPPKPSGHWEDEIDWKAVPHIKKALMVSEVAAELNHDLGNKGFRRRLRRSDPINCITLQYRPRAQALSASGAITGYFNGQAAVAPADVVTQTFALFREAKRSGELPLGLDVGRELSQGLGARITGLAVNLLLSRAEHATDGSELVSVACAAVQQGLGTGFIPRQTVVLQNGQRFGVTLTISDYLRDHGRTHPGIRTGELFLALMQRTFLVKIEFDESHLKWIAEGQQEEPTPSFFSTDILARRVTWLLSQLAPSTSPVGEFLRWSNFMAEPWQFVDPELLYQLNMNNVRRNLQAPS